MPTLAEEFAAFWAVYPRKVSRQDAMKAYTKARLIASAEDIIAGVCAFAAVVASEQRGREDMRFIPHGSTWLNKERWTDSYDVPAPIEKPAPVDWYVECAKLHGGDCGGDRMRHHIRMGTERLKAEAS